MTPLSLISQNDVASKLPDSTLTPFEGTVGGGSTSSLPQPTIPHDGTRSPSIMSWPSEEDNSSVDIEIISHDMERDPSVPSEWELDLRAGFSLEDRVKREWERQQAAGIPTPVLVPGPPPKPPKLRQTHDPALLSPTSSHRGESDWELVDDARSQRGDDYKAPHAIGMDRSSTVSNRLRELSVQHRIHQYEGLQSSPDNSNSKSSHPPDSPTDPGLVSSHILRDFDPLHSSPRDQSSHPSRPLPTLPTGNAEATGSAFYQYKRRMSGRPIDPHSSDPADVVLYPRSGNTSPPIIEQDVLIGRGIVEPVASAAAAAHTHQMGVPDPPFSELTDLDLLVARLNDDSTARGEHYEVF